MLPGDGWCLVSVTAALQHWLVLSLAASVCQAPGRHCRMCVRTAAKTYTLYIKKFVAALKQPASTYVATLL